MRFRSRRGAVRMIAAVLLVALVFSVPLWAHAVLPGQIRLARDQDHRVQWSLPLPVTVRSSQDGMLALNGAAVGPAGQRVHAAAPMSLAPLGLGKVELDFRLFGIIPVRRMTVDVVPPIKLVPGGHSIGVMLKSRGIMVVGYGPVHIGGQVVNPAREGGIEVGDVILAINGREATSEAQAAQLIEEAGQRGDPVQLQIRRRGQVLSRWVAPVRDDQTGRWKLGLYIRDGAMGIGTLTFYDPASGRYGALGHVIADGETNQPIQVREGRIVPASVTAIEPGRPGRPGEKIGIPGDTRDALGTIELNTHYGIFGAMTGPLQNPFFSSAVPVGMAGQVRPGKAEIITVVEEHKLERFEVEILRINAAADARGRNLVVRITDPRLLQRTGGIVQGMSGSPILQEGRLVGAVTHVFVNDPTRGYGVLMEWMLHEAGLLSHQAVGPGEHGLSGAAAFLLG